MGMNYALWFVGDPLRPLLTACLSAGGLWHSEGGSLGHQQPHHQREERPGELGSGTDLGAAIWPLSFITYSGGIGMRLGLIPTGYPLSLAISVVYWVCMLG